MIFGTGYSGPDFPNLFGNTVHLVHNAADDSFEKEHITPPASVEIGKIKGENRFGILKFLIADPCRGFVCQVVKRRPDGDAVCVGLSVSRIPLSAAHGFKNIHHLLFGKDAQCIFTVGIDFSAIPL